jgi:hypothetical protein
MYRLPKQRFLRMNTELMKILISIYHGYKIKNTHAFKRHVKVTLVLN